MCIKEVDGTNAFNEGQPPLSHFRAVGDTSRPAWRDLHVLRFSARLFGFSPLACMHFYRGGGIKLETLQTGSDMEYVYGYYGDDKTPVMRGGNGSQDPQWRVSTR